MDPRPGLPSEVHPSPDLARVAPPWPQGHVCQLRCRQSHDGSEEPEGEAGDDTDVDAPKDSVETADKADEEVEKAVIVWLLGWRERHGRGG